MLQTDKYITNKVSQEDLDKVFSENIVAKARQYLEKFSNAGNQEAFLEFFNDPDCSVIMAFYLEQGREELFLFLESQAYSHSSETKKKFLNFDWEVREGVTFANYYFFNNYNDLYLYDYRVGYPNLHRRGYILAIISYNSFEPWKTDDLPVNNRMLKDFYQQIDN